MNDRTALTATILRVIQRTADAQGNVTMIQLAENIVAALMASEERTK